MLVSTAVNEKIKILYIDDDPNNLTAFRASFRQDYDISVASSGEEGLKILNQKEFHVIIADQRMPGMTGVDFFSRILTEFPAPIRILLTGYTDVESVISAINKGQVYKYIIHKPWSEQDIRMAIENAYEMYNVKQELEKTNAELRKANDELMNLKDRLFSIIAHDLRGPISSLRSILELISKDQITEQEFKDLSFQLFKRTDLTYNLMESLLNWSRIQMSNFNIVRKRVEICSLIRDCIGFVNDDATSKNLNVIVDCPKELEFNIEPEMLKSVLRNLMSNAVKFTPENGEITISGKVHDGHLFLSVKDRGVGMSEENKRKLFRIDTSFTVPGTNNERGSGMGLIISSDFIKRMGGKLNVESELGQGSTFTIELPEEAA